MLAFFYWTGNLPNYSSVVIKFFAQILLCSRNNDTALSFLKALVKEDTLLPMMFLGLRKLRNICCRHKMFLNKMRNIFCVPDTKFVSATNVAPAGKRGNICVGNNVSLYFFWGMRASSREIQPINIVAFANCRLRKSSFNMTSFFFLGGGGEMNILKLEA